MSRAKTSPDASLSPPEFARLTFPDRGALEREIAANLRYGQVFVRELLKFPLLADGVIVIVHPVTLRELRLPAQIVMLNSDGAQRGTGLALRAFGRAEVEQLEAFARESGPATPPRRAMSGDTVRATGEASSNSGDGSHLVSRPVRTKPEVSASHHSAGIRSDRDVDRPPLGSQPLAAGPQQRSVNSGVQRLALERASATRPVEHAADRSRAPSSAANPAVRRPAREVDASPARPRSSANVRAQRPAQEIDGRSPEGEGRVLQPKEARDRTPRAGANVAAPRAVQEINLPDLDSRSIDRAPPPSAARARIPSRVTNAVVRGPTQEIKRSETAAEPARPTPQPMAAGAGAATPAGRELAPANRAHERRASSAANVAAPDHVEAEDWSDFEHEPEEIPTAKTTQASVTTRPESLAADEDDWSDFEHGPESEAVIPSAAPPTVSAEPSPVIARAPQAPASAPAAAQLSNSVDDEDWSDFEHGPDPSAVAALANVVAPVTSPATDPPRPAESVAELEHTLESDSLSIPYDVESARDRAPSAAFVSSPHTAVTHRPPAKDDSEDSPDSPPERS